MKGLIKHFVVFIGRIIVLHFKRVYKNDIIFFATSGIGDICYAFAFIDEIKRKNNKEITVITRKGTVDVVRAYDAIDRVVVLNRLSERIIKILLVAPQKYYPNLFNNGVNESPLFSCNQWFLYSSNIMRIANDYIEVQRKLIYNLDEDARISYPNVSKHLEEGLKKIYGGSVIINAESNSLSIKGLDLYLEKIIAFCNANQITVFTNVIQGKEPLAGTLPLACTVEELYNIGQIAGVVVSIRSGILDFLIGNGGRYLAFYNNEWNNLWFKAYSLKAWKSNSRIHEITVDLSKQSEQENEILQYLTSCLLPGRRKENE